MSFNYLAVDSNFIPGQPFKASTHRVLPGTGGEPKEYDAVPAADYLSTFIIFVFIYLAFKWYNVRFSK